MARHGRVKAKRRVTTNPGVRPADPRRAATTRRPKAAIVSAGRPPAGSRATPPPARFHPAEERAAANTAVDLSVDLGRGLVLANPILVASGTFGYGIEYGDVVEVDRLGAICCKGTTLRPRIGNVTPRVT